MEIEVNLFIIDMVPLENVDMVRPSVISQNKNMFLRKGYIWSMLIETNTNNVRNLVKTNNKDTRTKSMTSF